MAENSFTRDYILIALSAFFISVILTPIIRSRCRQNNMLDFPAIPRKIHTIPVPRLGGIAIYGSFFLPLFAAFLTDGPVYDLFRQNVHVLVSLFCTSTLIFAIGVYDDIRGATVSQKLFVQFVAAGIIYFLGFKIQLLSIPFVGSINPGIWGFPLTILWIVGVTNAINFIDGVDGLACGVGFFSVSTMFILSLFLQRTLTACFAAALAGGLCGFALYNFAPASIFMGDSGSLFIGFIIATISLRGLQKSSTAVVLLIPMVALGVPITDTLFAIIRRIGNGRSPFVADKEHIHHRLLRLGLSSRQVALILYGVCSVLGIAALLMTAVNNEGLTLILVALSVIVIGGMKMLGYTADMMQINHLAKERIQQRKRFLERQKSADEMMVEIQTSPDIPTLQKTLIRYFENMEFDVGKLLCTMNRATLSKGEGSEVPEDLNLTWYSPRHGERRIESDHLWTLTVPLIISNEKYGEFCLGKQVDSNTSLLESAMSAEHLKSAVEQALSRLLPPANSV
jgi:UDP-GlcNAc:undecaprenyl-phosphate GlcNAc-1-phosphate transferase